MTATARRTAEHRVSAPATRTAGTKRPAHASRGHRHGTRRRSARRYTPIIARNIVVPDPSHCSDEQPCRLNLPQGYNTARGTLSLSFSTQVHGVLGASPSPSCGSPAAGAQRRRAVSRPRSRRWTWPRSWGKNGQRARIRPPTRGRRPQRAAADTQAKINSCLAGVAHSYDALRQRMPACANSTGQRLRAVHV